MEGGHPRTRRRGPALGVAPDASILNRRGVAVVPLVVMAAGGLALALSIALRPPDAALHDLGRAIMIPGAVAFAVLAAATAAWQQTARGRTAESTLRVNVGAIAALLVVLTGAAMFDRGSETVAVTSLLLAASYTGFAFPNPWSRIALAAILIDIIVIAVVVTSARALDAGILFALSTVGWSTGLIPRVGYGHAFRQAELLSRSDTLTRILNRRGFLEQLTYELAESARRSAPLALLTLDLDGFKLVNDLEGHGAGDELLAWVGATIPVELPDGAAVGRLGGDEFAILLPGAVTSVAAAVAGHLQFALGERIGASIGIAATPDSAVDLETLLRTADEGLYRSKQDPDHEPSLHELPIGGTAWVPDELPPRPAVTFAQLQSAGGPPKPQAGPWRVSGLWWVAGFIAISAAGAVIVISTLITGGHSFCEELLRYGGVPWIIIGPAMGLAYRRREHTLETPYLLPFFTSSLLVGGGITVAALATGDGVLSPILAGLYLKTLFDTSAFPRRLAVQQVAVLLTCWVITLVLGPSSSLWAAPFQAVLFAGAVALGSIGRGAFEDEIRLRLVLAETDELTGLLNRRGLEGRARHAATLAAAGGRTLGIVAIDLDDFKAVNDELGHAGGDALLREVADAIREVLPDTYGLGRVGGDEFMAVVPAASPAEFTAIVDAVGARLRTVSAGSVGGAIYGPDGLSFDALSKAADHRAYAAKDAAKATG